jgi:hypothetical protein
MNSLNAKSMVRVVTVYACPLAIHLESVTKSSFRSYLRQSAKSAVPAMPIIVVTGDHTYQIHTTVTFILNIESNEPQMIQILADSVILI